VIRWPPPGRLDPELAAWLRAFRQATGISLPRLGRAAQISAGYLSELERGLKRPRVETVWKLDRVLHFDRDLREALYAAAVARSAYLPPAERPPGWRPEPAPTGVASLATANVGD